MKVLLKTFVSLLCSILYLKSTSAAVCDCCCVLYLMLYWAEKVPSESTEAIRSVNTRAGISRLHLVAVHRKQHKENHGNRWPVS